MLFILEGCPASTCPGEAFQGVDCQCFCKDESNDDIPVVFCGDCKYSHHSAFLPFVVPRETSYT